MMSAAHSGLRSAQLPSSSLGILPISAAHIPNNLDYDQFTASYDTFAASARIPALAYTQGAPTVFTHVDCDGGDSGEENYDLSDAFVWPGEGTNTREDTGVLPLCPKEDSYYLQFGDLTSNHHSVGGNERCWVHLHGRKIKAVVAEMYFLICRVKIDSGSVVASKIVLYYGVAGRQGNLLGYVSSGRVTHRYTGWKPDDLGQIRPGIPAAAAATSLKLFV
jgi:hypothetical protein